jgi:putative hydrolase of the HAD superfamily
MNKYKTLFFDLDHTLWDFERNSEAALSILYDEVDLERRGVAAFDEFNVVYHEINDKLWDRFRKGFLSREELRWKRMWQTLVHYRINDEKLAKVMSERYLEILPTQTHLFPHCHEMLAYCTERNYHLHLITNGFEATQQLKLKHSFLENYFDCMITSEQAMSMKPQKEIFEYALRETGARATESLMIGDALDVDVLGAQRIGMDQVFFNPKGLAHEGNPTYEIDCLNDMQKIV